jgi:H+/Cl- antiporter ClcA
VIAGLVTVAFRALVEALEVFFAGGAFIDLSTQSRFLFPVCGALLTVAIVGFLGRGKLRTGVVHVLERLSYHEGQLPVRNAVLQFFGGAVVLGAGLSMGREGPSIHLGATSGSLLGQWVRVPHNSLRTLVGCGVAAAIAASFNTPLAGVAFAMEVVLMEFTVASLTPVILAAVSGATIGHLVYGSATAFYVPPMALQSLWELPYIVLMGIVMGSIAAGFIVLVRELSRVTRDRPWWLRMIAAGILTGGCAMIAPHIMGVGYDSVNLVLTGSLAFATLATIVVFKILATSVCLAAGLPGGLIGPTLVIGAAAGGVLGYMGTSIAPVPASDIGLYAMLGMGAMMGATLQAPLAALLALIELTGEVEIVLPGMLVIVSASLAAKEMFACDSLFNVQMRAFGLDHSNDPVAQKLRGLGVTAAMSRDFRVTPARITAAQASALLEGTPQWLVIVCEDARVLLPAADLARHIEAGPREEIDLIDLPGRRRTLAGIPAEATLQAGLDVLAREEAEALYIQGPPQLHPQGVAGVLTPEQIDACYRPTPGLPAPS